MNLTVQRSSLSAGQVWLFFDEIVDVNDLNPAEEKQEAWEAILEGERVGMAVVDTFPTNPFVSRVAVKKQFRQTGVGTELLERIIQQHGSLACRVHVNNAAGQALVESVGFKQQDSCRFRKLHRYEINPADD